MLSLPRDKVGQVRLRYQAFFGQLGAALDGDWAFEDADASYFLLDSVALGEDAAGAACLLFADFAHYFALRKPREAPCLLFVDEFAAIAGSSDVAMKVEQARGFNAGDGAGAPDALGDGADGTQRDRILGSVETVIVHALNEPGPLAELGGTKQVMELTHRYEDGVYARQGHARRERRLKVDPDEVRTLPVGSAWVIRRGRAAKVAIARAPSAERCRCPSRRRSTGHWSESRSRRRRRSPTSTRRAERAAEAETRPAIGRKREGKLGGGPGARQPPAAAPARALGVRAAAPDRRAAGDPLRPAGPLPRLRGRPGARVAKHLHKVGLRRLRTLPARRAALGLADRPRRPPLGHRFAGGCPRSARWRGSRAVNEVRLHITRRAPEARWICGRSVVREQGGRGRRPNAVVEIGGERHAILVKHGHRGEERSEREHPRDLHAPATTP